MLLKNISTARGLVNGARGTVVGFEKSLNRTANTAMIPLVKFQIYLGSKMTEETVSLDQETWDIRQGEKSVLLASRCCLCRSPIRGNMHDFLLSGLSSPRANLCALFRRILASRVQIPLMLAWAISIHKVQPQHNLFYWLFWSHLINFSCDNASAVARHDDSSAGGVI